MRGGRTLAKIPKFNITINYPTPENQEEFENRMAKAVAKVLFETLPQEDVDRLIELYKKNKGGM